MASLKVIAEMARCGALLRGGRCTKKLSGGLRIDLLLTPTHEMWTLSHPENDVEDEAEVFIRNVFPSTHIDLTFGEFGEAIVQVARHQGESNHG